MGKSDGEMLYEFYSEFSGGKSLASGQALPEWDKVTPLIQEAWQFTAAKAKAYFTGK